MAPDLPAIDPLPWGAHLCHFYRTEQDLLDVVVPYFVAGIQSRQKCLWITCHPLDAKRARRALQQAFPSLDERIAAGQVDIHDDPGEPFVPDEVLRKWWAEEVRALADGYDGLRVSGNYAHKHDWDTFLAYERRVNDHFAPRRIIGLCGYSLDHCDLADIIDATSSHEYTLLRRDGASMMVESVSRRSIRAARERLMQQMVAVVAHDLGAPLNAVRMAGELLMRRGSEQDVAHRILRSATEIQRMSDDLVDLIRRGRGDGFNLSRERIDLNQLCREVVDELQQLYSDRLLEFRVAGEARAELDPTRMRQALYNLTKNALVHSPHHTPVRVDARIQEGRLMVQVSNQGVISDELLPHVFQPFERGSESRGLGLGLYIAKQIIEAHGGRLEVSTSERDGTVFSAIL